MRVLVACEESQEIWKDIPGYEGMYQASNLGRIRSVDRKTAKSNGVEVHRKSKVLSANIQNGYPHVNLGANNTFKVHYLVASTFLGERPAHFDVRHKDGNKHNNRIENLEYGTRSENNLDGYKIRGYVCKTQKLNPMMAKEIRNLLKNGESQRKLAKQYGVSKSTIAAIKNGEIYNAGDDGVVI